MWPTYPRLHEQSDSASDVAGEWELAGHCAACVADGRFVGSGFTVSVDHVESAFHARVILTVIVQATCEICRHGDVGCTLTANVADASPNPELSDTIRG